MNINGAQIHLLLNHIPVVGYPIIAFALAWGILCRQNQVFLFGVWLSILIFLSTLASYLTGEEAEDVLRDLPNFNIKLIHTHEDTALIALVLSSALGILALTLIPWVQKKISVLQNAKLQATLRGAFVIGVVVICFVLALAAHQGGLIQHTEIR